MTATGCGGVREKEFAGERGRCCAAVRCYSATATPCRRRSYHRRVPPPLLTAEGKPCLRCCLSRRRCWFTVRKGIIDAEIVVVLAPRELMSLSLLLVLNPITLILSYVCF
nr:uncharacterized protein LOC112762855 [Arachis hypogaea]